MLYITTCLACCKICIRKVTNPCCGALYESGDEQQQQLDLPWYLKIVEKQATDQHNPIMIIRYIDVGNRCWRRNFYEKLDHYLIIQINHFSLE